MTEPLDNPNTRHDVMAHVREGMTVYDADGHKLGDVTEVFMGDMADGYASGAVPQSGSQLNSPGAGSIVNDVASLFADDLPEIVRSRLRHSGFVRVDGGMLSRDRYALREQIASVDDKRVRLNVRGDALIKPGDS